MYISLSAVENNCHQHNSFQVFKRIARNPTPPADLSRTVFYHVTRHQFRSESFPHSRVNKTPPTPKLPSMSSIVEKRAAAREVIDILCEISTILVTSHFPRPPQPSHNSNVFGAQNTHLDRQTLSICVSLIENGVNPEALAVSDSGWEVDCGC